MVVISLICFLVICTGHDNGDCVDSIFDLGANVWLVYVDRVILLLMEKYVNRKPDTVVFFCKAISSNVVVEEDIFRNRSCFSINGVQQYILLLKTQSRVFCKTKHKVALVSIPRLQSDYHGTMTTSR